MKFRKGQKKEDKPLDSTAGAAASDSDETQAAAGESVAAQAQAGEAAVATEAPVEDEQQAKVTALEDQLLRLKAEFANFRKRTERERTELSTHVKATVLREILPTLDDFERFFRHVEERSESLDRDFVQGIEMIHKSLAGVLQRQGVEPIQETGVPFDPHQHEAMLTAPVESREQDHTVVQVLEAGYRMGSTVIRPARVQVGMFGGD
ncbi:nucleotide exchange factor GrpE [bacterium]|nr:nucleotide exchange factor GrpE [bacterium]